MDKCEYLEIGGERKVAYTPLGEVPKLIKDMPNVAGRNLHVVASCRLVKPQPPRKRNPAQTTWRIDAGTTVTEPTRGAGRGYWWVASRPAYIMRIRNHLIEYNNALSFKS